VYTSTFREWMTDRMGGESAVERLRQALLSGDAEALEEELSGFTRKCSAITTSRVRTMQRADRSKCITRS